jgi:hypothetical protein
MRQHTAASCSSRIANCCFASATRRPTLPLEALPPSCSATSRAWSFSMRPCTVASFSLSVALVSGFSCTPSMAYFTSRSAVEYAAIASMHPHVSSAALGGGSPSAAAAVFCIAL